VHEHWFRPRFRAMAIVAVVLGGILAVGAGATSGGNLGSMHLLAIAFGAIGAVSGSAYLLSPTWKLVVVTDAAGLEVRRNGDVRFRLPWQEVTKVIASPSTKTCFVDGGTPERSLLVPGVDAPASYDLTDKSRLYQTIVSSVPGERITEVDTLHHYAKTA